MFNTKDVSPEDTSDLAFIILERWRNLKEKDNEGDDGELQNQIPTGEIVLVTLMPHGPTKSR